MNLKIEKWQLSKIIPYELNVKKHEKEQVAAIVKSIKEFGFDQPIVVDKAGVIIKGHGRRLAAISLNMTEVPVLVRSDLTDEQVRAARLADNRVAMGDIDTALLRSELETLNINLLMGIFDEKELDFSTADLGIMNDGAFINDLDYEVDKQQKATIAEAEGLKKARVSLTKAIGFKDIEGGDEIYLSRFMSQIEDQSGLKGEIAFMNFVKSLVAVVSQ